MLSIIENIPDLKKNPLKYVFENLKLSHKPNTLWLEFGVATGGTINYISKFTQEFVYGFDSFQGLPEKWRDGFDKGAFDMNGTMPKVNNNVILIKGWFNETLLPFIEQHIKPNNKKISFIHLDADLYSSTKYILDNLKNYLDKDCILVFDELVNFPNFDSDTSELKAFYEFINENKVSYTWLGMHATFKEHNQNVAVIIHSVN